MASGTDGDDRGRLDDAQVQVGHQRERPAAGARAAVEDDRAGLGDRQRAAGQHAVERVEVARRERRVVDDELDAVELRAARRAGPRSGAPDARAQPRRPRRRGRRAATRVDGRAVLGHALAEALDALAAGAAERRPRRGSAARDLRRRPARGAERGSARRARGPRQRALTAASCATSRGSLARHLGQVAHRRPAGQARRAAARSGPRPRSRASRCARS